MVAPPQCKRARPLNHRHSAQDCVCAVEAAAVEIRCGHFRRLGRRFKLYGEDTPFDELGSNENTNGLLPSILADNL